MRQIGNVLRDSNNGLGIKGVAPKPQPQSKRQYTVTPLSEFQYSHLTPQDAKRLKTAVNTVLRWMNEAPSEKGLSLVLSGSYGTGKTTMAENAMKCFRVAMEQHGYTGYYENIANALKNQDMPQETRDKLEAILSEATPQSVGEILQGSLRTAAKTIQIAREGDFSAEYGRDKVVVIDDLGSEGTIEYVSNDQQKFERWKAYGNLIDYCYRAGKHVIITSNEPLLDNDGYIRDDFVEIVGGKAFDRLVQMANGYMVDLTGLPSYRPVVVQR